MTGCRAPNISGEMMPANRSRMPWSPADLCLLSDLCNDGLPVRAIAHQLQRSATSVQGMLRKTQARVLRGRTVSVQLQLDPAARDALLIEAKGRAMTLNTFVRILVELMARSPAFLEKLLDLDRIERNEVEEPRLRKPDQGSQRTFIEVDPMGSSPPMLISAAFAPHLSGGISI
jgi:hypothetical protein